MAPVRRAAPVYRERLSVPTVWWAVSIALTFFGGFEVFGGFNWEVAIPVYVILIGFFIAPLFVLGRGAIVIDGSALHAGRRTLPLEQVKSAQPLDTEGTRRWLGPAADPAAHLVMRAWIHTCVLVRVRGTGPTPYWLLSTRNPEALAAALRTSATRAIATT